MQASYAWQQATAANNIVQMQQPRAPKGHTQVMGPPHGGRMQGKPNKRMRQKTKPLGKHEKGQPTQMPEDFFEAMPLPKGAREYPKSKGPIPGYRTVSRPTQEEERAKKGDGSRHGRARRPGRKHAHGPEKDAVRERQADRTRGAVVSQIPSIVINVCNARRRT